MSRPESVRTESFQYPATHTGHLSDGQQGALEKFKTLCQNSGYYKPANPPAQPYPSHDNETMLRYLRARKFVPNDALKQFKETEDWRKSTHIDELYEKIDLQEYEDARKLYPQWIGRVDKRGVPVYVYEVANLTPKAISAYENFKPKHPTIAHTTKNVPPKLITLFALYENLIQMVLPFCSVLPRPHLETPMSQSSNIVDISNVGLKTFWNLKSHMQDASQLATAHYPETLDRIFIIGAPSFFPTVWSWIKRWFDPITVSKIFILSPNEVKPTLEKYMDLDDIPVKYGGNLKWGFPHPPMLEAQMDKAMHWVDKPGQSREQSRDAFLSGPIRWQVGENGNMEAVAVGSIEGKPRRMVVATTDATWHTMFGGASSPEGSNNAPVNWNLERVQSSTGSHTHPTEEGDPNYGASLKSDSGSNTPIRQQSLVSETSTIAVPPVSHANNTHDLPAKPATTSPEGLSPLNSQPRVGTSESRLEQQSNTHASNPNLAQNTPHVVDYGNGEKAAIVEPLTVGQAPKDVSAAIPEPEPHQETYMEQAQHVAHDAYESAQHAVSSVMAMVGGKKEEAGKHAEAAADAAPSAGQQRPGLGHNDTATTMGSVDDRSVEEMLRDQFSSKK